MRKQALTVTGSIFTALLASLCCIGPIVFALLGIGGAGFATAWGAYRPYFIGLTVVFLALGFYFTYSKKKVNCADGTVCKVPRAGKWNKIVLWIATLVVAFVIAFPYFNWTSRPPVSTTAMAVESVTLKIEGMTCPSCDEAVNMTLKKLDGVIESQADYRRGEARVKFDPNRVTIEQMVAAVNNLGYRTRVPDR